MRPLAPTDRIQYIRDLFAPEDAFLQKIQQRLIEYNMPIQIGAEEGKFLQLLMRLGQVKTIVEIGTLAGYSTIWMARALPEDGQIYTIEKDPERAKLAEETFATAEPETAKKITLLIGDAKEKLTELNAQAPFDMIFIDADKISYPAYLDWAEDNIRQGGIVIGDNSLLFDAIYLVEPPETIRKTTHKAMQEFNRRMADETKFMSVLLPTKEGMTVGVKALSQKERRSSS